MSDLTVPAVAPVVETTPAVEAAPPAPVVPEAIAPAEQPVLCADPAQAQPEPVSAPEAVEVPAEPVAVVPPAEKRPARKPRTTVSEDTLSAWQQRLDQDRAERMRRQREAAGRTERQQAFRLARRAVEQYADPVETDPALADLADDDLACAVHAAPERIRNVLAATLRMLQSGRR